MSETRAIISASRDPGKLCGVEIYSTILLALRNVFRLLRDMGETISSLKFKAVLKKRGVSLPTLAARVGASLFVLQHIARGQYRRGLICRRIEVALRAPIWTPDDVFRFQNRVTKWIGVDPYTLPLHPLRVAVRKSHGIVLNTMPLSRAGAVAHIEAEFMKHNPNIQRPV